MKWVEFIANLIFWLATGWLITNSFSIVGQEVEIENGVETVRTIVSERIIYQLMTLLAISLLVFYGNLFNLHRLNKPEGKRGIIVLSLAILVSGITVYILLERTFFGIERLHLTLSVVIGITLFYFTISSLYALVKVLVLSDQKRKSLMLANKQAELALLRNQLQPHFLFNALNNLLSLVDQEKSPQLSSSFEKLSKLLRYVTEEIKSEKVSVRSEIEFIRSYCDLQLLRFEEDEVSLKFSVLGDHKEQLIEPGLFIPFVENAFKYGTEPEANSAIEMIFDLRNQDKIEFQIRNKIINAFGSNSSTGMGISSTRERLELVYHQKHELEIVEDEWFEVELKIETV